MKLSPLLLSIALSSTAYSALAEDTPGKILAETTFATIDENGDGKILPEELKSFGVSVLTSMDVDSDQAISLSEFQGWDFGFVNIAEEENKLEGFATAQKLVFDLWDRDNDQKITGDELNAALDREFAYMDLDADGSVNVDEFLMGFAINVAYRSALKS